MTSVSTRESRIDTRQGSLFIKRWTPAGNTGSGRAPIILFHDSLGCVGLWRDFPENLAQATGCDVIAYDRLGFGQSDPSPHDLSLDFISLEASGAFAVVREALGLERFVAFGHSVGGAMAAVCAATFPEQCVGLITESAQAFVEDRTVSGIRDAREAFAEEGQLDRLRKYHGDKAAWVLSAWVDTWLSDDFQHWNLNDVLPLVKCPTFAIHGENDEYGSGLHPERFASLPAGPASMLMLPDCGHVPHREQQDAVIAAVREFLTALEPVQEHHQAR